MDEKAVDHLVIDMPVNSPLSMSPVSAEDTSTSESKSILNDVCQYAEELNDFFYFTFKLEWWLSDQRSALLKEISKAKKLLGNNSQTSTNVYEAATQALNDVINACWAWYGVKSPQPHKHKLYLQLLKAEQLLSSASQYPHTLENRSMPGITIHNDMAYYRNVLTSKLKAVKEVAERNTATQKMVDTALADLQKATDAYNDSLIRKDLRQELLQRPADPSQYPIINWKNYLTVWEHAMAVYYDSSATTSEITQAVLDLQNAFKQLSQPNQQDKSLLYQAVRKARALIDKHGRSVGTTIREDYFYTYWFYDEVYYKYENARLKYSSNGASDNEIMNATIHLLLCAQISECVFLIEEKGYDAVKADAMRQARKIVFNHQNQSVPAYRPAWKDLHDRLEDVTIYTVRVVDKYNRLYNLLLSNWYFEKWKAIVDAVAEAEVLLEIWDAKNEVEPVYVSVLRQELDRTKRLLASPWPEEYSVPFGLMILEPFPFYLPMDLLIEAEPFPFYLEYCLAMADQDNLILIGDVNADGQVDLTDARLLLKAAVGKITLDQRQKVMADIGGDGVNATDARLVLQYAVGKIPRLPDRSCYRVLLKQPAI